MSFTPLVSVEGANSGRGLSYSLWAKQPRDFQDFNVGFGFKDDFKSFGLSESGGAADGSDVTVASDWLLTNATAGTAALDPAAKGGVLKLDSASSTNNQGAQIQYGGSVAAASFVPSANAKIYYETRIKLTDIGSTTVQFFAGLAIVEAEVIASAANATANHIGYEAINTTALGIHSEKAGSRSSTASAHTIVADTYVKIGFVVDGLSKVTPYVNGEAKTAITTNVPIVGLTPTFVCRSSGTTDPILHIDWVACYQEEQIDN